MPKFLAFALILTLCLFAGCGSRTASSGPVPSACETLSKESVSSVQGEEVVDATEARSTTGDLTVTQCFYKLRTFSRSVNLEITSGPASSMDAYWNKRFRDRVPSEEEEEERERERESGKNSEDDKGPTGPQAVSGIGDEAFWVASQINGSLFVRRGSAVYRISIGGPEEATSRLDRATALANSFLNKKP
jgi:hypothetical protein